MSQPPIDSSDELLDLIFTALDHGIASVEGGDILIPFTLTITGGQKALNRFITGEASDAVEKAKQSIEKLPKEVSAYAIAFDAFVTIEGTKQDAIMVEAGERGKAFGHLFAQRYRAASKDQPLQVIGNAGYLGQVDQRLK